MSTDCSRIIASGLSKKEVIRLLDLDSYYMAKMLPIPFDREKAIRRLVGEGFLGRDGEKHYSLTLAGALLFSRSLSSFQETSPAHLCISSGQDVSPVIIDRGYLPFFLTGSDLFDSGFLFGVPFASLREMLFILAVYQDVSGGSSAVLSAGREGIFCTAEGSFGASVDRLIDSPLPSNPLASFLSSCFGLRGFAGLEASLAGASLPSFRAQEKDGCIRVTLDADRMLTCYNYACLSALDGRSVSNSEFRARLGLEGSSCATVSRIAGDALARGLLRIANPESGAKARRYLPCWA